MVFDFNKNEARRNQINILGDLQDIRSSRGFTELKERLDLHQNTLSKWLGEFIDQKLIEKLEDGRYRITDKGLAYHKKLLVEEGSEKSLAYADVLDFVKIDDKIKTPDYRVTIHGISAVSSALTPEVKQIMELKMNNEIIPQIISLYRDLHCLSGALSVSVNISESKKASS